MNFQSGAVSDEPLSPYTLSSNPEMTEQHATRVAEALGTLFRFCAYEEIATHATIALPPPAGLHDLPETRILERLNTRQLEILERQRLLPPQQHIQRVPVTKPVSNALDVGMIGNPSTPHFEKGLLHFIKKENGPLQQTLDRLATGDLAAAKQVAVFARALNQLSGDLQQALRLSKKHAEADAAAAAINQHVVTFHAAAMQVLTQHPEEHGKFELRHHDIDTTADLTISRGEHIRRAHAGIHAEINAKNPHAHQIYTKHQELGAKHQVHDSLRTPAIEAAVTHHLGFAEQMLVARERADLDNVITLSPRAFTHTPNKPSATGVVTSLSTARAQRASGN